MVRINKSDRPELLKLLQGAVKAQIKVYDLLTRIGETVGHITGLDAWVLREAGDWDEARGVKLTDESLTSMLREVRREK
jgi:hypothetical protein